MRCGGASGGLWESRPADADVAMILPLPAGDLELAGGFHVPDVVAEMSAAQVLTTEWVPGVAINKVSELSQEVMMLRQPSISRS